MIDIQDSSSQPLDNIPDSTQRSDDSILSGKDQIGADLPVQDSTQASTNLKEEEALEDLKYYARSLPDVDDLAIQPKLYPPKRFDAKEKLAQVERGLYLTDYLDSISSQDFAHGADDVSKEEIERILKDNYRRNEDGTIEMVNKNQIERQRQVLGFLVKQLGSALFSGKSLSTISLPVTIFEPQSYLERQAYGLSYAPYFLERAGQTEDVLEQFKLTVAHYLASLQLGSNPQKPFNPHLGETFQGVIAGCPVYVEHISNTPPVSAIQMVGKNFNLDGVTEFTASIAMNSVKSWKVGYLRVNLLNNKTTIFAQYPPGYMQGTAMGRRLFQFADKFYIFDLDNRLYAEVDMDLNDGSWFRNKSKEPKDRFQGGIWRVNEAFVERLENALVKKLELGIMKFKEKDHAVCKLETIEGSWLENVKIGEKQYWSYGNPWPHKLHYFNNPLPSDSNFRTDVLYLRLGDETRSQEDKQELGEVLRQDQKLRDQYKSKNRK